MASYVPIRVKTSSRLRPCEDAVSSCLDKADILLRPATSFPHRSIGNDYYRVALPIHVLTSCRTALVLLDSFSHPQRIHRLSGFLIRRRAIVHVELVGCRCQLGAESASMTVLSCARVVSGILAGACAARSSVASNSRPLHSADV